ncbi:MAG: HAD family phosphatase, partial [Oscillospiraceae bacterium]|nr:HAD family phosphatase [Oscillospiraceae bacterium]
MVRAIIFDLDGLLVDTEIIAYRTYQELLAQIGGAFTKEVYVRQYSGKTLRENVVRFIRDYSLPWSMEEGLEKVTAMEAGLLSQGVELKPGGKELLAYLKSHGYRTALATSSVEDRARRMLRQHGLTEYFEQFVFGHEVDKGKPAPDIFRLACEKLGEAPENCLVLEDSGAGIQAARAAGIPVICVPDMKRPPQETLEQTAAVLDSLDLVIPYLT